MPRTLAVLQNYGVLILGGLVQTGLMLGLGRDAGLLAIACYLAICGLVFWRLSAYGRAAVTTAVAIAAAFVLASAGLAAVI